MGDRCYIGFHLHGHVDTIEKLEEVVEAIECEFNCDRSGIYDQIVSCLHQGKNPFFEDMEVNYGDIEELEGALIDRKVDFFVDQGSGDEFSAQCRTYNSADDLYRTIQCTDGPVIKLSELEKALKHEDPLKELTEIIEGGKKARGEGLPTFSVSHEVRGWLDMGGHNLPKIEREASSES